MTTTTLLRSTLRALPLSLSLLAGCQCDREVTEVPGNITGKVCDDIGRPLVSAALEVSGRASRTGLTNASGEYSFEGLLPGKYTVKATLGDTTREFLDVEVVALERRSSKTWRAVISRRRPIRARSTDKSAIATRAS